MGAASSSSSAADVDPKMLVPVRVANRKLSDAGSVQSVMSGTNTATTAIDLSTEPEDTTTIFESAATESLPDFVSISRSDPPGIDDRISSLDLQGEPPDSAAALAALNRARASGAVEDSDHLLFMLERPFAGLEPIFEEEDSDDERLPSKGAAVQLGRAPSTTSFQTFQTHQFQTRQTSSWRAVCGHSGPVGDPASRWALRSPEPLSAELARTAPCTEVSRPLSPYNAQGQGFSPKSSVDLL